MKSRGIDTMPKKCNYCEKEPIVRVGSEETPLCEEHFIEFLRGARNVIDKITNNAHLWDQLLGGEEIMVADNGWLKEVPEKPGPYWFYGWFNGQLEYENGDPIEPRLDYVNVTQGQNCMLYYCVVEMQYTGSIRAVGKWKPMEIPKLPDLSEYREPSHV